ncbi:N-acetylglucosamine-induced protein 1 [Colletotrichum spinosum]|uniref:N-acetylglucosamine-induced protein 1 n=1 Tax=Colletotrichum spinosum TaxID=1347390 RepID=A0A4R8PML5_9PEZI|nr:N-acetylglucosamine-induced protein 1 [Colletotrichum spinosum]
MDIEAIIRNPPFKLTEGDIRALRGHLDDFNHHTWEQAKQVIAAGEMGQLQREPRDLRNYIMWLAKIGETHGSVLEFVRRERLHWPMPIVPRSHVPFAHPEDWKILWNDWSYGFADGIMHLVVWSKSVIPVDAATGLPTAETTRLVENFLDCTFGKALGCRRDEDLLWFKQKAAWQSVRAVEHIHVLVRHVQLRDVERFVGRARTQTLQVLARNGNLDTGGTPMISSKMI